MIVSNDYDDIIGRSKSRVEAALELLRAELGVSREVFAEMTIAEVRDAETWQAWCGIHKGKRDVTCAWCRMLARAEKDRK